MKMNIKILGYKPAKHKKYIKYRNYTNKELINKIDKLICLFEKKGVLDSIELFQNKRKLIIRNLWSGITKGIGTAIGFTVIASIIIYILQYIIRLNIPVIGKYIKDILDIVQKQI